MIVMEKPASSERVILIHCSASSARQWRNLSEQLVGFQPMPIDLWGHGNQHRWHGSGPLRLSEEARAIQDVCPDGAPFHLVGHSYGGAVALQFAVSHPERLHSLTLIEPSCFHVLKGMDAQYIDEIRSVAEAVNREVICGDYMRAMEIFITYWGGVNSWDILPDDKKAQFALVAVHIAHHFWSLIQDNNTPLTAYASIDVPTLILCGTHSPPPSRVITRLLAEAIPRARLHTLPYANHMSPINRAAEVNAVILEHLLALPRR